MNKIEINKEIILMRKNVDQAKIHIIKKHTRDAMKLRQKKGTDAQKEKNARKADRIAAEILAVKKVKNDEITKHILTNTLNLQEILNNRESDSLTRMMARIANHKIFSKKIAEFKEKYPNYMEFLGPGRKKKAVMEWKEKKKLKKKGVDVEDAESDKFENEKESSGEESSEDEDESDAESSNEMTVSSTQELQDKNKKSTHKLQDKNKTSRKESQDKIKKSEEEESVKENGVKNKVKKAKKVQEEPEKTESVETSKPEKSQKRKKAVDETKEEAPSAKKSKKKKKSDIPKVISKQAVVKKFTEILKEDESNVDKEELDSEPAEPRVQVEKEEDPFFVTGDGQSNYLSVAPVRNKSDNQRNDYDEDEDDYRGNRFNSKKKFSRADPEKYFSNVSKFKNGNFNNKADARWDAPKRNGKEKPGRNANFSKFNDARRDKSKPFSRESKGGIESASNEILHPSWEAKKKQQEALKKGFQGKKIVFGDDDA